MRSPPIAPDELTFRPVTRGNRADFERLFSAPGAPKQAAVTVFGIPQFFLPSPIAVGAAFVRYARAIRNESRST